MTRSRKSHLSLTASALVFCAALTGCVQPTNDAAAQKKQQEQLDRIAKQNQDMQLELEALRKAKQEAEEKQRHQVRSSPVNQPPVNQPPVSQVNDAAVANGRGVIERNGSAIFYFAQFNGTYRSLRYDGLHPLNDGFKLRYTLNYEGAGLEGNHWIVFDFVFDRNGRFLSLSPINYSLTSYPPFSNAAVNVNALNTQRNHMRNQPVVQNNAQLLTEASQAGSQHLCEMWLRLSQ